MAVSSARVLEAVDTFAAQRAELVQTYVRQVWNIWKSLTPADWWNDAVTLGAAAQAARFEIAFLEAVGRLGVSYADAMLGMAGVEVGDDVSDTAYVAPRKGTTPLDVMLRVPGEYRHMAVQTPAMLGMAGVEVGDDVSDTAYVAPRKGTTPLDVMLRVPGEYRHMAVQTPLLRPDSWDSLEGADLSTVTGWLRASLDRLQDIANTDAQLTAHRIALGRFESRGVTQYRRVIHPELSKTGTCGLCAVASTRTYHTSALMPLHSNCKCGVRGVTQYRRVIHPELSKTGTCGLCAVASTRTYHTSALMPLHSNCKCGVAPITTANDVGKDISDADLQRFYDLAGGNTAADLKSIRLQVQTNGELGPILADEARKSGRTVSDWTPPDRKSTREQAKRIIRNYRTYDAMYKELLDVLADEARKSGRTVSDWTPPDRKSTREQAKRIIRNYRTYDAMYKELLDGKEQVNWRTRLASLVAL